MQVDGDAVPGDGGDVAQLAVLLLPLGAQPRHLGVGVLDVGRWPHMHVAERAIDDDGVARLDEIENIGDVARRRDAERARDDGDMAAAAGVFEHEAAQFGAVIFEQRGRPHGARDDDRIVGQFVVGGDEALAGQLMQQAVGEIVEIVQPLAHRGFGAALQLGAGVVLDALDRRLGGEAGVDGLAQTAQPAAVMGDHAEGLQHVAMFARPHIAAFDQAVDRIAHRARSPCRAAPFRAWRLRRRAA